MNTVYALQCAPTTGLRRWNWRWTEPGDVSYQPVSVDVHDDGQAFVISALLPGVAADDLKIEIEGDTISLRGEIKADPAEAEVLLRERFVGKVGRTLTMPVALDSEHSQASLQAGVLTLRVPKAATARRKVIPVTGP
ncbi:MAG: Hsp20/alpha crystallin family protein [Chloroflexi bacterium]|nr:Hsp20/alpha crystallin family protein [Chloroflexota bacterium]